MRTRRQYVIHSFTRRQTVRTDILTCWKFFSNPHNLEKITPSNMGFRVVSDIPDEIHEGMMIEYRVRPIFGIPMTWLTEISHVRGPRYFVDEQRVGPYALWHHEHEFVETGDGCTEMIDRVHYVLPFSPLSEPAHPLLVGPQLKAIFDHRIRAVEKLFGREDAPDPQTPEGDSSA